MTGTPQQYCLRWNNYQNNLTNVFDQLLQSEAFVDCSLATDGQSLKCHKMVLSACSPFFQNLFFDNPCSHPIVILKDIRWEELKAVVEFMYRGEINVSQEQLAPLLKVAEVLKIRGLADVSRGSSGSDFLSTSSLQQQQQSQSQSQSQSSSSQNQQQSSSSHRDRDRDRDRGDGGGGHGVDSDSERNSPSSGAGLGALASLGNLGNLGNLGSLGSLGRNHTPNGNGMMGLGLAHVAASLRRKRRKISTPDRTPSPSDSLDDQSNPHELDSNNGDYMDHSPATPALSSCEVPRLGSSANNTPSSMNSINPGGSGQGGLPSSAVAALSSIGPAALLNLHNAAAAANSSSSVTNELDLKPGIVEMIREEERAKMMESSHGWMGPASTLSDSYQYQIQNLWQKCWNTNQGGMLHALRFRERGPLKSWRPETMAEAIFAVLREGLSLSQAARKFDIPYPTFVLYANRVHNMLGPSADGCSGTDLISDNRPKGRGRPQRILLGTWPEDHIRGVIRAVVFRDTGGKDDVPFLYGRESGMMPQPGTSHNGLDMSLHPFGGSSSSNSGGNNGNPFLSPVSSSSSSQQQQQQQSSSSTNTNANATSNSIGGSSSSTNHLQGGPGSSPRESGEISGDITPAQLQLLQKHHQQQLLAHAAAAAAEQSGSGQGGGGSGSSRDALAGLIPSSAHLSSVLQQHHQRLHSSSHHHLSNRSGSSSSSASSSSILPLLNLKGGSGLSIRERHSGALSDPDDIIMQTNPEILQIKAEIAFEDLDDDEDPEEMSNSEDDEMHPAVSVISSTAGISASIGSANGNINSNNNGNGNGNNMIQPATATAAVVLAPSPVHNNNNNNNNGSSNSSPPPNSNNASDGNNFLPEPEVNTVNTPPPPHFQAS